MGFFTSQTKVIDLGGGNTVTLRKPTFADAVAAQSASARTVGTAIVLDYPRLRLETVKRTVIAWDGPDFDGQPPTPENIEALPSGIGARLADEAQTFGSLEDEEGN